MLIVPQNVSPPQAITVVYKSPSFGANLSTVTAVSLSVLRSDGTTATWAATIKSATPEELVVQYVFQTGDVTATGVYYLQGRLTLPGGVVLGNSVAMYVTTPSGGQSRLEESAWLATTVDVEGATISSSWHFVSSGATLSPFTPWVSLDSRAGGFTVTLWSAQDGDVVIVNDPYGALSTHAVVLAAYAGQQVPTGVGTYGSSVTMSVSGSVFRLKFSSAANRWQAY